MSALSAKPSIVSPTAGVGISGSCMIAPPTSAEAAVGSATTSRTSAVQLSALPESSAAATSALRGVVGSGALAQELGDAIVGHDAVHAVAAQEKPVVQRDRLRRIVEARFRSAPSARVSTRDLPGPPSRE